MNESKLISERLKMSGVLLDPRLKRDCHPLGRLEGSELLLMRNALFPWFVLVPETAEIEFYRLEMQLQMQLLSQINLLSEFIVENFPTDKINIGMIGNMVSQLHVHVVGRNREDSCWPGVVWGTQQFRPYETGEVVKIAEKLTSSMHGRFSADPAIITLKE
ncbi:MAG: HIT family protein [Gammaproteobacteria bacterium]|nr:HIT family protein [Gammaproteobacteria bacterium]